MIVAAALLASVRSLSPAASLDVYYSTYHQIKSQEDIGVAEEAGEERARADGEAGQAQSAEAIPHFQCPPW